MRTLTAVILLTTCALLASAADRKPVMPAGVKPAGAYSPGIVSGEFLYVSGMGAATPDQQLPKDEEGQFRQCFENVKAVVEHAGLTMEHVVYVQVYLTNYSDEGPLNRVWKQYFPKAPPARSTIGVSQLKNTPIEISAVAVKDLSQQKSHHNAELSGKFAAQPGDSGRRPLIPFRSSGPRYQYRPHTGRPGSPGAACPRSFCANSPCRGRRLPAMLSSSIPISPTKYPMNVMNRIYAKHFEFGNTPARATIKVAGLPSGANIEFTGVAVLDLSKRRAVRPKNMEPSPTASPCVFADDTFYCSAKSGFIPGVQWRHIRLVGRRPASSDHAQPA